MYCIMMYTLRSMCTSTTKEGILEGKMAGNSRG